MYYKFKKIKIMKVILSILVVIVLLILWYKNYNKKVEKNRKQRIDDEIKLWVDKFNEEGFNIPVLDFDKYLKVNDSKNKYIRMESDTYFIDVFFKSKFRKLYYEKLSNKYFAKIFKYKDFFDLGLKFDEIYQFFKELENYDKTWVSIKDYQKIVLKTKTKEILRINIWGEGGLLSFELTFDNNILVKQKNI